MDYEAIYLLGLVVIGFAGFVGYVYKTKMYMEDENEVD